ncbi:MAG: ATP-binding protein [Bifidobacteriaceae bacterium]|jgi:predicted AAA+ superfamily ATPase|nr:ATP-binding protein [Bifidobacteriaceae bacterium]
MIQRALEAVIRGRLGGRKAIILMGARQVGKTTLLRSMLGEEEGVLWLNADEVRVRVMFEDLSAAGFAPYIAGYRTVVVDEAQRVEDIGIKLKILQDAFGGEVQVIATGSSSFELANHINEPMTGRKREFRLFPLTAAEMVAHHGLFAEEDMLESRLRYGWYPDVVTHPEEAQELLVELAGDNLFKDVLRLRDIRRPAALERLVRALAFQVGSQVNLTELGSLVGLDKNTVESYVRLLEQAYIVFRVGSFARNLRNELTASSKLFFYDVGIRNALIGDFSPPGGRGDIGALFENFVIAELVKAAGGAAGRFWRTQSRQEIDYVVGEPGALSAYEVKWNPRARARWPSAFVEAYRPVAQTVVNRDNAIRVVSGPLA